MRSFGIFAALAVFTSVFAAPLPAPATDALVARDGVAISVDLTQTVGLVSGVVNTVKKEVDDLTSQIEVILGGVVTDVNIIVDEVTPLLEQLIGSIKDAAAQAALATVGNVTKSTSSTVKSTVQDAQATVKVIKQDVDNLVAQVSTVLGQEVPTINTLVQELSAATTTLTQSLGAILQSILGKLLGSLGVSVPKII